MSDNETNLSVGKQGLATGGTEMDIDQPGGIKQPLAEDPQEAPPAAVSDAKARKISNIEAQYYAFYKEMLTLSAPGTDDKSRDEGADLALWLLEHEDIPIEIRVQAHITRACYGEGDPVWHGEQAVKLMEKAKKALGKFGTAENDLLADAYDALELAKEIEAEMAAQSDNDEEEEGEEEDETAERGSIQPEEKKKKIAVDSFMETKPTEVASHMETKVDRGKRKVVDDDVQARIDETIPEEEDQPVDTPAKRQRQGSYRNPSGREPTRTQPDREGRPRRHDSGMAK